MNITSFNPIYGTEKIEEAVKFFGTLGFQEIHKFEKEGFELRTLENAAGLKVDVMNNIYVREMKIEGYFSCRLNVDDMGEAIRFFEDMGAEQMMPLMQEGTSRELTTYKTPNGDIYSVIHHAK